MNDWSRCGPQGRYYAGEVGGKRCGNAGGYSGR